MRLDDLPESGNIEDRRGEGGLGEAAASGLPLAAAGWVSAPSWCSASSAGRLASIQACSSAGPRSSRAPASRRFRRRRRPRAVPASRKTRPGDSSIACSTAPMTGGKRSLPRTAGLIARRSWFCTAGKPAHSAAALRNRPWVRSIVPPTRVYLDTSFFDQIATRFRGCDVGSKSCQFSQAYVIAHEVGHHVQNLSAFCPRHSRLRAAPATERRRITSRCRSSCRRIVSPAYGRSGRTSTSGIRQAAHDRAGRRRGGTADGGGHWR